VAELYRWDEDTRESWLRWAIELGRRGLRPIGKITVHGPHGPHAPFMWGEAECVIDGQYYRGVEVEFRSGKPRTKGWWDVHHVRVWTKGDPQETWPIVPASALTPKHRKWVAIVRKMYKKARRERELDEIRLRKQRARRTKPSSSHGEEAEGN